MFDVIIKNGLVLDGLGSPGRQSDLGIKDGKIAAVAAGLSGTTTTIDARGKVVCPGFIDMHAHSGLIVFEHPELLPKIRQGVTSEAIGMDGITVAPVTSAGLLERQQYVVALDGHIDRPWSWRSFQDYLQQLQQVRPSTNLLPFVPHGAVRDVVMGLINRAANEDEMTQMCAIVDEALTQGAVGLSFGLIYMPGAYAQDEEILRLVQVAAHHQKSVTVHVRNEAAHVVDSVKEMAEIAKVTGAKMNISHLKIVGHHNQHLLPDLLQLFEDYQAQGVALSFDQYPYWAGSTQLAVLIPPWAHDGGPQALLERLQSSCLRSKMRQDMENGLPGWENLYQCCGWENIFVSSLSSVNCRHFVGRSIDELAHYLGLDPFETVFNLLLSEKLTVGMIDFYGTENTVKAIVTNPFLTVSTDGIFNEGNPHPRLYGAFPRILGRYVREEQLLTLPEAIHKMTARPAHILGLKDRGVLQEGYQADIVVFDAETIIDTACYEAPRQYPRGIEWVIVNGVVTIDNNGRLLTRNGRILID